MNVQMKKLVSIGYSMNREPDLCASTFWKTFDQQVLDLFSRHHDHLTMFNLVMYMKNTSTRLEHL